jgi:beta-N-acetylhexosaminidase
MVGVDVRSPQTASYAAVSDLHVGNVFLAGRTQAGVTAVRDLVDSFTTLVDSATTHNTPLFVATDQEGGAVQVLRGAGFSDIPSAMTQASQSPEALRAAAATWGGELAAAGVNLNLAPVMDYVPSAAIAARNPPIGYYHRNYGYTPDSVTSHANAFSAGMEAAGIDVAIKHFPSLGLVRANTDTTAGVTDDVITTDSHSVGIFKSGVDAGAAFVMLSTAVYAQIDPSAPGAFSPVVVGELLRQQIGFGGVVITDDVSAAKQVQAWSPADRAMLTIEAGGDMVLASADPSVVAAMVAAVTARAQSDPAFAAKVDAAAARVVAAKQRLLH